jgi:hypothetical protein
MATNTAFASSQHTMVAALWVADTGDKKAKIKICPAIDQGRLRPTGLNSAQLGHGSTIARQIQRCLDLDTALDRVAVVWLKGCGRRPHAPGRLCCGGLAGSMAMLGMPLLILNLGGEMVYILDQVDRTSPHCFHSAASF